MEPSAFAATATIDTEEVAKSREIVALLNRVSVFFGPSRLDACREIEDLVTNSSKGIVRVNEEGLRLAATLINEQASTITPSSPMANISPKKQPTSCSTNSEEKKSEGTMEREKVAVMDAEHEIVVRAAAVVISGSVLSDDQLLSKCLGNDISALQLFVQSLAALLGACPPTKVTAVANLERELKSSPPTVGEKKKKSELLILQEQAREEKARGSTLFIMLDVIATLAAAHGLVRELFRPHLVRISEAGRKNKPDTSALFGVCCALSNLTLADTLNGRVLLEGDTLDFLLELYRGVSMQRMAPQSKQINSNSSGDGSFDEKVQIMRWAREAMLNMMKVPFEVCDEKLKSAKFGAFGSCVAMDELKWELKRDREKTLKILEEFRSKKN